MLDDIKYLRNFSEHENKFLTYLFQRLQKYEMNNVRI
jgi:hypothetical protein